MFTDTAYVDKKNISFLFILINNKEKVTHFSDLISDWLNIVLKLITMIYMETICMNVI